METLRGKVAVVTGAASGIGFGMAEAFAAEGMRVVLADVEPDALAVAAAAITARGADTLAVHTDVTVAAEVAALAGAAFERFGAVHVLCNNAGVGGDGGPLWEQTLENWQWVLGVNLWGVIHGIHAFVPRMLEQGEGHVVNTASMAGLVTMPFLGVYHASKHAVVALSESLHHELAGVGAPVRVSVLCPGFVRTRIIDGDRNRPAALRAERPLSEAAQAWQAGFRALVDGGIPPSEVAARVVEAIRGGRFWVFPHPDLLPAVRERAEGIVAARDPSLSMPMDLLSGSPK